MPRNRFIELPLDSLYELFVVAVTELIEAMDNNDDTLKARKKNVESLLSAIEEVSKKDK